MLRFFVLACTLAAASSAGAAQVSFDGIQYALAHVEAGGSRVVNRYASPQSNRPALVVRQFKGAAATSDVIAVYLDEIRSTLLDAPLTMRRSESADDVVLVMFRKTADSKVVEYVLERFARVKDGVVAYRFSELIGADADLTPVLTRQPDRIEQLFDLELAVSQAL
jgi:hypothetical protein